MRKTSEFTVSWIRIPEIFSIYYVYSINTMFISSAVYIHLRCIKMGQKMEMILKKIPIRINFEGEEAERFNVVKEHMGLKQNTEVIRALISGKYQEIKVKKEKERLQRIREAEAMEWLEKNEYKCPM